MRFITPPTRPTVPTPDLIADQLLHRLNSALSEMVHQQSSGYNDFWNNSETPDDILEGLGNNAEKFIKSASILVTAILELSELLEFDAESVLPESSWKPRREFVFNGDGTVSLETPAEGYDAWGNQVVDPNSNIEEPADENLDVI